MKLIFTLLFSITLCCCQVLIAQNLLSNGDFESYTVLPTGTNQAERCVGWRRLNGTPDYYHVDGFMNPSQWGVTPPKSGKGQMGIVTYWTAITNYREYISAALDAPLIPGQATRVCFYWRSGTPTFFNTIYSNNFGVYFTDMQPVPIGGLISANPQWEAPTITQIMDDWVLLTFDFVPNAAFTHITLGNFRDDANTLVTAPLNNNSNGAYYYIDSLVVTQNFVPVLTINGNNSICTGESSTLTATNGDTYSWAISDQPATILQTGSVYSVNPSNTTTYLVYSSNDTTSFTVNVIPYPIAELGPDTSLCPGETLILNLTQPGTSYLWDDQSTLPVRSLSQTGIYSVELNKSGCIASDTIKIEVIPFPKPSLGNDTTLCMGDTLQLLVDFPNATITWQDNSVASLYTVSQAGTYTVAVSLMQCLNGDTITITSVPIPFLELGNDTTLCDEQSLTLDITQNNAVYLWQDGITSPVYQIQEAGLYYASISKQGCSNSDSLVVSVLTVDGFSLGPDTSFCAGESLLLSAENPGSAYSWQDGSSNQEFLVTQSGAYSVNVVSGNCSVSDTILIVVNPLPFFSLGADTNLCTGDELLYNFNGLGDQYNWNDGSNDPLYQISAAGNFSLIISKNGCESTDSLNVTVSECPTLLTFPNVFSPNGDSYNELFTPSVIQGISKLSFTIYNRWGNTVYYSEGDVKWNGQTNGSESPEGVYFWIADYSDQNGNQTNLKGSVTLIK